MKEKMNKLMILIYILLLFGCKSHSVCNEMPLADKVTQKSKKTTQIDFNHFKVINSDEYRNSFSGLPTMIQVKPLIYLQIIKR